MIRRPYYVAEGARGTQHVYWIMQEQTEGPPKTAGYSQELAKANVRARAMNDRRERRLDRNRAAT